MSIITLGDLDMTTTSNDPKAQQFQALIKEAMYITEGLAAIDKKIEADLRRKVGDFAMWWEENIEQVDAVKFGVDQVPDPREKVLESIFTGLFKLLKWSKPAITLGSKLSTSAVLAPFGADKQPSYKMAYFDSNPKLMKEYLEKTDRLERIYMELFFLQPTSAASILQNDLCAKESCWTRH
jgi:hypothetical protein